MKTLCIALLFAFAVVARADDEPAKPGFFQRALQGTKNAITSPFRKKTPEPSGAKSGWRRLEMTMRFEPAEVRLPATRAVDVIVTVANKGKEAVQLEFPSSLRIDVVVKDSTGRVLSRWSDDQRIEREPAILVVNPKERLEYTARISTRDMAVGSRFEIEAFFPSYEALRTGRFITPVRQ